MGKGMRRINWEGPRRLDAIGRSIPSLPSGFAIIMRDSIPEPNTGCWLWLGALDPKGYGRAYDPRRGSIFAHRLSLMEKVGDIGDLYALHKCDQPSCVNPDHLFPGTAQDNTDDMIRKGRWHQGRIKNGEDSANSILTVTQVLEIRASYVKRSSTHGLKALAGKFGVAIPTIYCVINRDTWRHVP